MREVKFRLRNRFNKVVGYEKWYIGVWHTHDLSLADDGYWEAPPCWMYSADNTYWTPATISHRYKDTFTGLPDKNGKEIYEGDLFHFKNCKYAEEVYWDERSCEFRLRFNGEMQFDKTRSIIFTPYSEVIGNIYENPEFLK